MVFIHAMCIAFLATALEAVNRANSRDSKHQSFPSQHQQPPHPDRHPPHPGRGQKSAEEEMRLVAMYHTDNSVFEPDGHYHLQHEFKVSVGSSREECFFQKIKSNSQFHFYFQVLSGADRNIDVIVRSPDGRIIDEHLWTSQGRTERTLAQQGVYAVCLENFMSRFSSKLVHFYLVSFLADEWQKLTKDLEQFDIEVQNFTHSLEAIQRKVNEMQRSQAISRQAAAGDWYLLKQENDDVTNWSLLICILIALSSVSQVVFVRRLFRAQSVTTATSKPRA